MLACNNGGTLHDAECGTGNEARIATGRTALLSYTPLMSDTTQKGEMLDRLTVSQIAAIDALWVPGSEL